MFNSIYQDFSNGSPKFIFTWAIILKTELKTKDSMYTSNWYTWYKVYIVYAMMIKGNSPRKLFLGEPKVLDTQDNKWLRISK